VTEARVDAVVVAYRSAALLPGCLDALRADPAVGTITVVDHGDDHSDQLASDLGADLVISDSSNPGFGAGQNLGVAAGDLPFILLCNPDAKILPGVLDEGMAVLDDDPGVGAVQGVIADPESGSVDRSAGNELGPAHLWARALGLKRLASTPIASTLVRAAGFGDTIDRVPLDRASVETLAATAPLIRRSAFESVGGFDESYFLYGEDLDLCRRLRSDRWDLLALPTRWADHREGASSTTTASRERAWWGGTLRFAAQWWSAPRWWQAQAAAAVAAIRFGRGRVAATRENWRVMVLAPRRVRRARTTQRA